MRKFFTFLFVLSLSVSSLLAQDDKLSILLVNDDNMYLTIEPVKAAMTTAGYDYDYFDAGADNVSPSLEVLSNYELVVWYTGKDYSNLYLWNGTNTENEALKTYLDNGGMLWLQGRAFLYAMYSTPHTFVEGDFAYDYLGVKTYFAQSKSDDGNLGVSQLDLVAGNGIATTDPIIGKYSTIWYADACELTDNAQGVYKLGPTDYVLSDYYTCYYNEVTDAQKVLTYAFETSEFKAATTDPVAPSLIEPVFQEALDYFNTFANTTKVPVTSFAIAEPAYTKVQPFASLQLSATDVLPAEADNKSVTWTVVSGDATINQNGLLTAGTTLGAVVVSATTNDGSAISHEITTLEVADKLSVLLVNDNNWTTRIETIIPALEAAGYTYTYFDAGAVNESPSLELMSAHDLVVWYTGNDAGSLLLWGGDDTDNEDLKTYLDNGGMLWLQGLDFFQDKYKTTPNAFVEGDFAYDYLGIKTYAVRTPGNNDVTVGVPQFDLVADNGVVTLDPLSWSYGTMWSINAFEITANAQGVYKIGPDTHTLAEYYGGVYNETANFKVFTLATETARLKNAEEYTNPLFSEVLAYFNSFVTDAKVPVTEVTISAANDAIALNLSKTLQFSAAITPAEATNQSVTWNVSEGAGASINQNGLLTSTDVPETVTITATANDGSGVSDSYEIEIKSMIPDSLSILLVQDNSSDDGTKLDLLKTAIAETGHEFTCFNAVANGQAPSAELLAGFELVIWYTGNDEEATYLWNGDDTDNTALETYLDNGGMLWLQGLTFLYDKYGVAPQDFATGDFAYDYLGAQKFAASSYMNDDYTGVTQLDVVDANGIATITPLTWLGDAAMNYVAGCDLNTAAGVYEMGPSGYALEGKSAAFYNEVTDGFKALTFTFDPIQLKDPATSLNPLYKEVLEYFNAYANTEKIHAYDISVASQSGKVAITEENGTLQFVATVLPESTTNKTVTWSLGENSVPATISPEGLLTASGTIEGNGTVFVTATSNDRPEYSKTIEVSIIGQAMTGFTVLLVNDHDYNERYLNINTALTESGYAHILYNTTTAEVAPSADYMSHFDMVFWYTGNDYEELYLWDVSEVTDENPNGVKANAAIIEYINNGGIFFQTGLEAMRDIYGRPDDDLGGAGFTVDFKAGDFIYDYMGISQYIRSGKNDDGISHLEITDENIVTTTASFGFSWSTMWHGAGYAVTDNATALYKFPTSTHAWSEFPTIVMNKPTTGGTVITNGSELAMLGDGSAVVQETVNTVTKEFIDYFATLPNSINDIERNTMAFSMYPNPTRGELNINFEMTTFSHTDIMVMDNTGRRVLHTTMEAMPGANNQRLDVSQLNSGVYFISIRTNNAISSSKFIVE